ncbi:MAG: NifU family protein [Acidobacteriota bacterium]|jgi:Fe-S cluster biogenesis protein NfuA|nr:NifU family protein [Acidobacteriota bacterium]
MDVSEKGRGVGITAEPTVNPAACRFTVEAQVYPGRSAYFPDREAAALSPLARRIFEIPGVGDVLVGGNQVTVSKPDVDSWQEAGKLVGEKIREHLASGDPAVDEAFERTLPPEDETREKVRALLEEQVNPMLSMHGGFVQLIDMRGNAVFLKLGGGCRGCASAALTLKMGIERIIREQIPTVGEVLDTTDHASGRNPYYQG